MPLEEVQLSAGGMAEETRPGEVGSEVKDE